MVIGIGVDVCTVSRIARLRSRYGDRFLMRIFSPAERSHCESRALADEAYAVRFAAREAFLKALGTGLAQGVTWRDIEVTAEPSGKPRLLVTGRSAAIMRDLGADAVHVSLSHEHGLAVAMVILEATAAAGQSHDAP